MYTLPIHSRKFVDLANTLIKKNPLIPLIEKVIKLASLFAQNLLEFQRCVSSSVSHPNVSLGIFSIVHIVSKPCVRTQTNS